MVLIHPPSSAPRCRMRLFRFTSFFALGHQRHLTLTFHDMLLMLCAVAKRPSQWPWYDRDVCSHHQHDRLPLASPEVLQGFPYQCGISGPTCVAHRVLDLYLRARTAVSLSRSSGQKQDPYIHSHLHSQRSFLWRNRARRVVLPHS